MTIFLLDDSLQVNIFFDKTDCSFDDNICVSVLETSPDAEAVFIAGETNIYLTSAQARQLSESLLKAADESDRVCGKPA